MILHIPWTSISHPFWFFPSKTSASGPRGLHHVVWPAVSIPGPADRAGRSPAPSWCVAARARSRWRSARSCEAAGPAPVRLTWRRPEPHGAMGPRVKLGAWYGVAHPIMNGIACTKCLLDNWEEWRYDGDIGSRELGTSEAPAQWKIRIVNVNSLKTHPT